MDGSEDGSGVKVGYTGLSDAECDPRHDTGRLGSGKSGGGSTGSPVAWSTVREMGRSIPGFSAAFRGDTEWPTYFPVGESRYEIMETSSSVTTVLMVGAELEQVETVVNDFFWDFGTLMSNMSSQPDLYSKVRGRAFEVLELLRKKLSRPKFFL